MSEKNVSIIFEKLFSQMKKNKLGGKNKAKIYMHIYIYVYIFFVLVLSHESEESKKKLLKTDVQKTALGPEKLVKNQFPMEVGSKSFSIYLIFYIGGNNFFFFVLGLFLAIKTIAIDIFKIV